VADWIFHLQFSGIQRSIPHTRGDGSPPTTTRLAPLLPPAIAALPHDSTTHWTSSPGTTHAMSFFLVCADHFKMDPGWGNAFIAPSIHQ